jgi:hypothetical protein
VSASQLWAQPGVFKALTEQKSQILYLAALFWPGCQYLLRRTITIVPSRGLGRLRVGRLNVAPFGDMRMANLSLQINDYRLTTAEILYHMPDYPSLRGFDQHSPVE